MADEVRENGHSENGDVPEIELIIRASTIDGRPELKTISLKVTTVDMQKPPPDFRTNFEATPPPILIDRGMAILENEKIERHIMKTVPGGHNLFVQDKEVATLIENLYTKFKMYVTKYESLDTKEASQPLFSHLERINDFMVKRGTRFLTGDTMSCFDCELMPRLQHIRIGAKAFRKFEIPNKFQGLWRYMANMYELEAFRQSCPADQDIISHIKNQLGLRTTARIELETPVYTTSIPMMDS
ncbi:hypothetical protein GWI33_020904 [Rhynchophorus ferrugineus]|uniref:Chloride intracellular channel exc-4 n=1 Tax=Rhynchophorus ferrugineus TaxID=354439 RepID=A0A834HRD6_RHYFE|nr:hypothetical protein GWI33_020904 [Rhynchophorus ferrugineus]